MGRARSRHAVPVAFALRRTIVRTARSPLARVWALLYARITGAVARRVAPDESLTNVFLSGSLAWGEPLYGLSDIDLIVVATDEDEAGKARARFDALCRRVPPLRGLIPHFWPYSAHQLERALRGPYPLLGEAAFVGPESAGDSMALLQRPSPAAHWRRVRGRLPTPSTPVANVPVDAWLELQHRWRYAFKVLDEPAGPHTARLASGLVSEAARLWLLLARDEVAVGRRAPLERAFSLLDDERDGLAYALRLHTELHRSPRVDLAPIIACFAGLSGRIAELLDERTFAAGSTAVTLVSGDATGPLPLVDWRTLALPAVDWSTPELPFVVEERLRLLDGDPTDPGVLARAAEIQPEPWVPVLRQGSLLVQPTHDVWVAGRLRVVQCRTTDPVSFALLDGDDVARFPDVPGWSALDRARQAVAEHRAWLLADPRRAAERPSWTGPLPQAEWATPASLGLLLAAARAALQLESIEQGRPELALGLADAAAALDAGDAYAELEECRRRQRPPGAAIVARLRARVVALDPYAGAPPTAFIASG